MTEKNRSYTVILRGDENRTSVAQITVRIECHFQRANRLGIRFFLTEPHSLTTYISKDAKVCNYNFLQDHHKKLLGMQLREERLLKFSLFFEQTKNSNLEFNKLKKKKIFLFVKGVTIDDLK